MITTDALLDELRDLVSYPSVNPPGEEGPVAEHLVERLEASPVPFEIDRQVVEPDRPNVIARSGDPGKGTVLLLGHTDVVPVDEDAWTTDPFTLRRDGDRVVGRGVADMKGALAGKLLAAEEYLLAADDPGSVVLAFVMGEETTGRGAEALVESGPPVEADGAIIGEPTDLNACVAHKGVLRYGVTVRGRSVHAGRPGEGVSAIDGGDAVLDRLRALHREERRGDHELLTPGSVTVTEFHSGIAPNVVPDRAELTVDWRTLPDAPTRPDPFDRRIEAALEGITVNGHPIDVGIDRRLFARGSTVDPDAAIVRAVLRAARDRGVEARPVGFDAGTDARFLVHDLDVPTVVFGPGSLETEAHTVDESVRVDDLVAAARVYRAALDAMLEADAREST